MPSQVEPDTHRSIKKNCRLLRDARDEFFHTYEEASIEKLDQLLTEMENAVKDLRRIHDRETNPDREKSITNDLC